MQQLTPSTLALPYRSTFLASPSHQSACSALVRCERKILFWLGDTVHMNSAPRERAASTSQPAAPAKQAECCHGKFKHCRRPLFNCSRHSSTTSLASPLTLSCPRTSSVRALRTNFRVGGYHFHCGRLRSIHLPPSSLLR